jgi:hypothetical protein
LSWWRRFIGEFESGGAAAGGNAGEGILGAGDGSGIERGEEEPVGDGTIGVGS